MTSSNREIEIKLRLDSAAHGRRLLQTAGFQLIRPRTLETNLVFDTPAQDIRRRGELLRLRQTGAECLLTYKGPKLPGKYKIREELEVPLPEIQTLATVFQRLGLQAAFRYEKYRSAFRRDPGGHVFLDETPIGDFLELEGEAAWIDRTAALLGRQEQDYITADYGRLYLEDCARRGLPPGNLVFGRDPINT